MRNRAAPLPPRSWLAPAFALVAVLLGVFFLLAKVVVLDGHTSLDQRVTLRVHDWVSPGRTEFMRMVTALGASWVAFIVCGGIVLWLARHHRPRTIGALLVIFVFAKAAETGFKEFFARPRPEIVPHLVHAGGYSFPSGHTITAVIVWGLLATVLVSQTDGRIRIVWPVLAALIVAAVGISRIYLGVHYLTDVIGGVLLAGAFLIPAAGVLWSFDRSLPELPG